MMITIYERDMKTGLSNKSASYADGVWKGNKATIKLVREFMRKKSIKPDKLVANLHGSMIWASGE